MKKFALSCLVALLVHSLAISQSITEYRYWWNDDVSTAVTETVSNGQTLNLDTDISTSLLSVGHHNITFQVKDENDEWSIPMTRTFYQSGDMIQYEYWFDDDLGNVFVETVPQSSTQIVTSLDASALSNGIHEVTFRALSNNGEASATISRTFKVAGGDIINWEYWFNDDLGTRVQQSVTPPTSTLELVENLDASALSEGTHTVTWRCEDESAIWSVPITYEFDILLSVDDIPGLNSVMMFPNPTKGDLNIKIDTDAYLDLNVEILNQQGQVLRAQRNALTTVLSMDVSDLAAGIYFVRLSDNDRFVTYKFVKQ